MEVGIGRRTDGGAAFEPRVAREQLLFRAYRSAQGHFGEVIGGLGTPAWKMGYGEGLVGMCLGALAKRWASLDLEWLS